MLEAHALSCERDDRCLFDELTFTVKPGHIWQIEGANGAGKTTLLRILCGLNPYFDGQLLWAEQPLQGSHWMTYWQSMTYLGHAIGIKSNLTVIENLRWLIDVRGEASSADLHTALQAVALAEYAETPAGQLSAGQQRRIGLARLLVEKTALWILDEPFTSLDKQGVAFFQRHLVQHAQQGGMVILTTHQPITLEYPVHRLALSSAKENLLAMN